MSKFQPGPIGITATAAAEIERSDVLHAMSRHLECDWGDLDAHDNAANEAALVEGTRLLSSYKDARGTKFWIITEADRSSTTVLLPSDY